MDTGRTRIAFTLVAALVALGACTGAGPEAGEKRQTDATSHTGSDAPVESPMPEATRPVAGTRAASEILARPDVRPTRGHVSENGDLLVWWQLQGLRDRDLFRCRYPVVLTWAPRNAWQDGVRRQAVRAWVLAEGARSVTPTATGFYLDRSDCAGRDRDDQTPALVIHRGRLGMTRLAAVPAPPREGSTSVTCPPGTRGSCQLDPATATVRGVTSRVHWEGAWDPRRSILWKPTVHISGTWSVDGGLSWNQFIDPWDAAPLRRGDELFAASNSVRSAVGELVGGQVREGFREWSPEDLASPVPLPRSQDGYRSWQATPDGSLVGIARGGAVYVSDGTDWDRVTRRDLGRCRSVRVVGLLLECGELEPRSDAPQRREIGVSDDLGRTWSTVALNQVVPEAAP